MLESKRCTGTRQQTKEIKNNFTTKTGTLFSETHVTVVAAEKHIWIKPMWSIPDASNVSARERYSLHFWKSNDDGRLFHKETRKVLYNYGKSIQTIAYFFSKIYELIRAEGGDPASGYFEGQFKEVESRASSSQTKMNKRQETAKAWAKKCEGMCMITCVCLLSCHL